MKLTLKNAQSSAKKSLNSKTAVIQQTPSTLNAAKFVHFNLDRTLNKNKTKIYKIFRRKKRFRLFEPFEKFAQENRIDNKEDIIRISRKERKFFRNQYNALSDGQMLKYIKQAEKEYDSFDVSFHIYIGNNNPVIIIFTIFLIQFERNKERPLFTSFLNKREIKILFNSYELPESVP